MVKRILTALAGAVVLFVVMLLLPSYIFVGCVYLLGLVAVYELYACFKKSNLVIFDFFGYAFATCIPLYGLSKIFEFNINPGVYFLFAFVLLLILTVYMIVKFPNVKIADVSATVFGGLYITATFMSMVAIRLLPYGEHLIWILFVGVWMTDISAYTVGMLIGKTHFLEKVSPKKSLEGSIGGIVGATLGVAVLYYLFFKGSPVNAFCVVSVGLVASIISQVGDWTMSVFKRLSGIKDFGWLFPGHGGVLDRFDSMIFTAPMILGILMLVL